MNEFLLHLDGPQMRALYRDLDAPGQGGRLAQSKIGRARLPLQVAHLSSIWTVCHTTSSRYNWMLQYYLKAEGLALSWIGTGRLVFSLNFSDADFEAVAERFLAAAEAMRRDVWWRPAPWAPTGPSSAEFCARCWPNHRPAVARQAPGRPRRQPPSRRPPLRP